MIELNNKIESYLNYLNENLNDIQLSTISALTFELKRFLGKNLENDKNDFYKDTEIVINDLILYIKQINDNEVLNFIIIKEIQSHIMKLEVVLHLYNPSEHVDEESEDISDYPEESSIISIDPHENLRWGGLTGEEAYDAYWNTD